MEVHSIVRAILALDASHPIRIGIDGFCAAGKTTLASALEQSLRAAGRGVIRASTDDFQNPPEMRWQLGDRSPEGFYRHQIDFISLRALLLEPLAPTGSWRYLTSSYDVHASSPKLSPQWRASPGDILLLDGLFLHSPILQGCFELTVFVRAELDACLSRARRRNQERISDARELEAIYREKYMPGFRLYCEEAQPHVRASLVIDN